MIRPLEGRTAIVTGGGSGIGRDFCLALAAAGANVAVAVRRVETGEDTVSRIATEGGRAAVIAMDVSDARAIATGVTRAAELFGGLDIVLHNANNPASAMPVPADAVTAEDWAAHAAVTLGGAVGLAQAAHSYLRDTGRGRFIVLTSSFGYHGAAMNTIYSAQKASLRAFIKSLAREWGPDAITVNAIAPSAATEPTRLFFDQNPVFKAAYLRKFPLGRLGRPREDIGEGAVALCSDALGYMTGQTLFLDGGLFPSA